jgi:DNA-binding response OmpR family regulator
MSGYVSKPIDQAQLLAAIAALLGGDAAQASDLPARDAAGFDLGGILADLDRLAG